MKTLCAITIMDLSTAETLAGLHSVKQPHPITLTPKGANII